MRRPPTSPRPATDARGAARLAAAAAALAAALAVAAPSPAVAGPSPMCRSVPAELLEHDAAMPRLARRLARREPITVVMLGSGSLSGGGLVEAAHGYPAQLRERLAALYPEANVEVRTVIRRGATAADLAAAIRAEVLPLRPALVLWHAGAVDAMRHAAPADFGAALTEGIDALHRADADVLLVEPQYSPYSQAFASTEPYVSTMRWTGRTRGVASFRRYAIMSHWWERGAVDLAASDRKVQADNAVAIFDCLGRLIAGTIDAGVRQAGDGATGR